MILWFLLYQDDNARVRRAFQTLMIYVGNVARNPDEDRFRTIRLGNPKFQVRYLFICPFIILLKYAKTIVSGFFFSFTTSDSFILLQTGEGWEPERRD